MSPFLNHCTMCKGKVGAENVDKELLLGRGDFEVGSMEKGVMLGMLWSMFSMWIWAQCLGRRKTRKVPGKIES